MKLKGALLGILLGAIALVVTPKPARAATLDGFFITSAPPESVQVYRQPKGSVDTLRTTTDEWCYWSRLTQDFEPDASIGDTIFLKDKNNTVNQRWIINSTSNHFLDMYPNKHTVNVENVIDTCHVTGPLKMEYYLPSFTQPETTVVDTGVNQGLDYYYDIHAPFDKSAAVNGRNGKLKLFKINGDTTFSKTIDFTIDKTNGDAQLLSGPIYFPDTFTPNGVEMSYFGAMPSGNGIKIEWQTESALDSYLWKIMRGKNNDSLNYDLIATQPGDGNSNQPKHWFYDDGCARGKNWYKLIEVDFSGAETPYGPFSATAGLEGALSEGKFRVWPNPAKSLLQLKVDKAGNYSIHAVTGQRVGKIRKDISGATSSEIKENSYPAGVYFMTQEETGDTRRLILIK